jgi:hypothetical protein
MVGFLRVWVRVLRVRFRLARGFGDPASHRQERVFSLLAGDVWAAPGGSRTSRLALRAAREAAENPFALRALLAEFCSIAAGRWSSVSHQRELQVRPTPRPVTGFLLEPVGDDASPRVAAFLRAPALPLPGPANCMHHDLARWLVYSAMAEEETGPAEGHDFGPLSNLLAGTDVPALLEALQSEFAGRAHPSSWPNESSRSRSFSVWEDGEPTLFAHILMANPHLPVLPPLPDGEPPRYVWAFEVCSIRSCARSSSRPDSCPPPWTKRDGRPFCSPPNNGIVTTRLILGALSSPPSVYRIRVTWSVSDGSGDCAGPSTRPSSVPGVRIHSPSLRSGTAPRHAAAMVP